jgi:hypothetical protein
VYWNGLVVAVPLKGSHNNRVMNKIEYRKILDIMWALRSSELRAKTEWDKMVIYKDDDEPILYELAYEKVKGLRQAQKDLAEVSKLLGKNEQLQYSE